MKKIFSVVLTSSMIAAIASMNVSAKTFTDNDEIKHNEAVDVISALGIVDGNTDGSFAPEDPLTRGAASKIICNMLLGSQGTESINVSDTYFNDVPSNHTFAPYITYCVSEGIVSGCGDGTFNPDGYVTGDQFLKMLLVALGYDSEIEGFVGENWSENVEGLAASLNLTKGNPDFIGENNITREEACLYALNALKSDMVEYDGNAVSVTSAENSDTIYDETTDTVSAENPDTVQFGEKYFPGLKLSGDSIYNWFYTVNGETTNIGTYVDTENNKIANTGKVFFYNQTEPVTTAEVNGVKVNYYNAIVNGTPSVIGVEAGGAFSSLTPNAGLYLGYTADDECKYITDIGEWVNGNDLNAPEENTAYYTKEINGYAGVTASGNTMTIDLDTDASYTMADGFKAFIMEPNEEKTALIASEIELGSEVIGAQQTRAVVVTNDSGEAVELYIYGLDNDEIEELLSKTIELAGDDPGLQLTQGLQCKTADVPNVKIAPNYEEHAEPTKLFDNLYFIGGTEAGVFVFEDEDGYIMIDSGYNYMPIGDEQVEGYIIPGMEELGLDPSKIKVILITHLGPDHIGGASYFEETYGTKVIYGIPDAEQLQAEIESGAELGFDVKVEDDTTYTGDNKDAYGRLITVTCGENTIMGVACPRTQTNNGQYSGMSYIAKVTYTQKGQEPVEHIWATYGNTNVTGGIEDMEIYHTSVTNFLRIAQNSSLLQRKIGTSEGKVVDVVISNHPFVDMSIPMMEELRENTDEEGNFTMLDEEHPFVWGADKVETFLMLLDTCREVIYTRAVNGIDATGTAFLK